MADRIQWWDRSCFLFRTASRRRRNGEVRDRDSEIAVRGGRLVDRCSGRRCADWSRTETQVLMLIDDVPCEWRGVGERTVPLSQARWSRGGVAPPRITARRLSEPLAPWSAVAAVAAAA